MVSNLMFYIINTMRVCPCLALFLYATILKVYKNVFLIFLMHPCGYLIFTYCYDV